MIFELVRFLRRVRRGVREHGSEPFAEPWR
jgi:hypothetical protein